MELVAFVHLVVLTFIERVVMSGMAGVLDVGGQCVWPSVRAVPCA